MLHGCTFANRCPAAMPMCLEAPPPLYRTDPHRAAACYLDREAPALKAEEMATVFVAAGANGTVAPPAEEPTASAGS